MKIHLARYFEITNMQDAYFATIEDNDVAIIVAENSVGDAKSTCLLAAQHLEFIANKFRLLAEDNDPCSLISQNIINQSE